MARESYSVTESVLGTGDTAEYTFDFKIEDETHLLMVELDEDNEFVQSFRGDDEELVSNLEFDEVEGGGTVTLVDDLETDHTLILLLANDEPTQPSEFKEKSGWTLRQFEMALDRLAGAIQRLTYRSAKSLRSHEKFDPDEFDMELPHDFNAVAGSMPAINEDLNGFEMLSPSSLLSMVAQRTYPITDGQAATILEDADGNQETFDGSVYVGSRYECVVIRGTTVCSKVCFDVLNLDGSWKYVFDSETYHEDGAVCGVTFAITLDDDTVLITAAADSGAGDGYVLVKKHRYTTP